MDNKIENENDQKSSQSKISELIGFCQSKLKVLVESKKKDV